MTLPQLPVFTDQKTKDDTSLLLRSVPCAIYPEAYTPAGIRQRYTGNIFSPIQRGGDEIYRQGT